MYLLTEIIGVVAEVLIIWLFIQGIFPQNHQTQWLRFACFIGYGIGLAVLSLIEGAMIARISFCGFGITFLVKLFYEAKFSQAIFAAFVFCSVYMMSDVLIYLLASNQHLNTGMIMQFSVARCIYILTTHILLLVIVLIVLLVFGRKRNVITIPFILVLSPGYVMSIFLGLSFCQYLEISGKELPLPFLFASLALLYMNIVLVIYAVRAKQTAESQRQVEIAEHHYAMQEQYYEQLRSEQDETRAMFHDIRKHLRAMQVLVEDNRSEQAQQLMDDTTVLYHCIGQVVDVGNSVISALLNEYKQKADENGIDFSFSVSIPPNLGITAVDCYIILGNTLDNAIEGALSAQCGQRSIALQLRQHQNTLFYKVENTCSAAHVNRRRNKSRGYGLQNVKKCVEKYSGDMTTETINGKYIFMARLTSNLSHGM